MAHNYNKKSRLATLGLYLGYLPKDRLSHFGGQKRVKSTLFYKTARGTLKMKFYTLNSLYGENYIL